MEPVPVDPGSVRAFLLPLWRDYHRNLVSSRFHPQHSRMPEVLSEGLCRHTTLFLYRLFRLEGDDGWAPQGGLCRHRGSEDRDIRLERGWRGRALYADHDREVLHYPVSLDFETAEYAWFDGRSMWDVHWWLRKGETVVDLTADQFGWAPVIHGAPLPQDDLRVREDMTGVSPLSGYRPMVNAWLMQWEALRPEEASPDIPSPR